MSKVWFITGAGSGIGAATARAALGAGDRVVATGRNPDKIRNALRGVASDRLAVVQLDVADAIQAKAAVDKAMEAFGRIDVLVNNAGYSLLGNFEELTTAEIDGLISTNLHGVVHVMRAVIPVMRKQRSGKIINVSSVRSPESSASSIAGPIAPPSSPSKAFRSRWLRKSLNSASLSQPSRRAFSAPTSSTIRTPGTAAAPSTTMLQKAAPKQCGPATTVSSRVTPPNLATPL